MLQSSLHGSILPLSTANSLAQFSQVIDLCATFFSLLFYDHPLKHAGVLKMSLDDISYYRRRAAAERAMALRSEQQQVREIHEELARQYEALVEQEDLRAPLIRLFA